MKSTHRVLQLGAVLLLTWSLLAGRRLHPTPAATPRPQPSSRLLASYLYVIHHHPTTQAERRERARVLVDWDRATFAADIQDLRDAQNRR